MDYRAAIISIVWIAITVISAVYMWVFAEKIGDVLFGVFLPVGLLVLVAIVVTVVVVNSNADRKWKAEIQLNLRKVWSYFAVQCSSLIASTPCRFSIMFQRKMLFLLYQLNSYWVEF